jgi:hypothetical protein
MTCLAATKIGYGRHDEISATRKTPRRMAITIGPALQPNKRPRKP